MRQTPVAVRFLTNATASFTHMGDRDLTRKEEATATRSVYHRGQGGTMRIRGIRILLMCRPTLQRDALRLLLEAHGGFIITSEVTQEALAECDVALVASPENVTEVVRGIREHSTELPVLILAADSSDAGVVSALDAGADGYVLTTASTQTLLEALRETASGRPYFQSEVAHAVLSAIRAPQPPIQPPSTLNTRERKLLELMSEGLSNREIAGRLHLTQNTIKTHLRGLFRKLGVRDRTQAVVMAMKDGLLASS